MIDDVIRREGGIVDHPADRGGPTHFGIIQRTLTRYLGRKTNKHDARKLSRELASEIDRRAYYLETRLDTLPERVRAFLFDSAVNHGSRWAIQLMQQVSAISPSIASWARRQGARRPLPRMR